MLLFLHVFRCRLFSLLSEGAKTKKRICYFYGNFLGDMMSGSFWAFALGGGRGYETL